MGRRHATRGIRNMRTQQERALHQSQCLQNQAACVGDIVFRRNVHRHTNAAGWCVGGCVGDTLCLKAIFGTIAAVSETVGIPAEHVDKPFQRHPEPSDTPIAVQMARSVDLPSVQVVTAQRRNISACWHESSCYIIWLRPALTYSNTHTWACTAEQ